MTDSPYRTKPTPVRIKRDIELWDGTKLTKGDTATMLAFYPRTAWRWSEVGVEYRGVRLLLNTDMVEIIETGESPK